MIGALPLCFHCGCCNRPIATVLTALWAAMPNVGDRHVLTLGKPLCDLNGQRTVKV
jgi:hypothetical protein